VERNPVVGRGSGFHSPRRVSPLVACGRYRSPVQTSDHICSSTPVSEPGARNRTFPVPTSIMSGSPLGQILHGVVMSGCKKVVRRVLPSAPWLHIKGNENRGCPISHFRLRDVVPGTLPAENTRVRMEQRGHRLPPEGLSADRPGNAPCDPADR
jgi:hypothetical protein